MQRSGPYLKTYNKIELKGTVSAYSIPDVTKKRTDDVFCIFLGQENGNIHIYALHITYCFRARVCFIVDAYIPNNAPYARTMKRGRPTKHPSDARRYRLELRVGERAKEVYERWHAFLDGCQDCHNNVDLLNKAIDCLLER